MDLGTTCFNKYTWHGLVVLGRRSVFRKLDQGLCNDILRNMFPKAHVQVLHRLNYSDHHHILIHLLDKELCR